MNAMKDKRFIYFLKYFLGFIAAETYKTQHKMSFNVREGLNLLINFSKFLYYIEILVKYLIVQIDMYYLNIHMFGASVFECSYQNPTEGYIMNSKISLLGLTMLYIVTYTLYSSLLQSIL